MLIDRDSIERGWDLLCLCSQYFPPSVELMDFLIEFIEEYEQMGISPYDKYCKFCKKYLSKLNEDGSRLILPTLRQIAGQLNAPFNPPLFGSSLQDIMEMQEEKGIETKFGGIPKVLFQSDLTNRFLNFLLKQSKDSMDYKQKEFLEFQEITKKLLK